MTFVPSESNGHVTDWQSNLREARVRQPRRGPARVGHLAHRYDIAGLVRVGSEVVLHELEWFVAPHMTRPFDIEIHVGQVGSGRTRRRAALTSSDGPRFLRYEEQLGRFGANFRIEEGEPVVVTVTPLLAHSPHVLYCNIVEVLLRFMLAARGRMLLHSACLEMHGKGVLLSARTDTGKTSTILRLLRNPGIRFLADDMTILEASGSLSAFPKPLTVSEHTVTALDPQALSVREWAMLRLQSKVHSKGGRGIGMRLGQLNLPILGMNAITQMLVPPPKYVVDRLIRCEIADVAQLDRVFLLARGYPSVGTVSYDDAVEALVANTEDAYGFPPYRQVAPELVIGDTSYDALRDREREILRSALVGRPVHELVSETFSWAEAIPMLLGMWPSEALDRPRPQPELVPTTHELHLHD